MRRAVAVLGILIGCDERAPAKPPAPPPRVAHQEPAAPTPPKDPPRPARSPILGRESWFLQRVSADGKRVLLRDTTRDATGREPVRYRVIRVDTNTIESEVSLPTLAALPTETLLDGGGEKPGATIELNDPALSSELIKIGPILAPFALGHGGRVSASPDGTHVAFNGGDWIYTATNGRLETRITAEPSYDPWFSPDGKTLFYRRMNGTFDGVEGKYELYATSLDGKAKSQRIEGTAGAWEPWAIAGQAVRFVATAGPKAKTCIIEVPLVAPFKAKRLACAGGNGTRAMGCVMSPRGTWAACGTVRELAEDDPHSTTTVRGKTRPNKKLEFSTTAFEVETGKVGFTQTGTGSISAISDDGTLIMHRGQTLLVIDRERAGREVKPQSYVSLFTFFRDATHLITEQNGDIVVLDIAK